MPKKASAIEQVKVRMRTDQKRKLEREAERNGLTVNAEILRRLEQTFEIATSDETAVAFRAIQNAIEFQEKASGNIPQDAGAPAQIIAHSLAHLLAKVFSDFRNVRLSFGRPQGSLTDSEGEEQIILVRAPRERQLDSKPPLDVPSTNSGAARDSKSRAGTK